MFTAFFSSCIKGASSDFKTATSIAKQMVMYYGMSENVSIQTEQVRIKSVNCLYISIWNVASDIQYNCIYSENMKKSWTSVLLSGGNSDIQLVA